MIVMIADIRPVSGQVEHSVAVAATAEAAAPCVREHEGEVAALDALAQQSNWSHAPPSDLEAGERKPHMVFRAMWCFLPESPFAAWKGCLVS